jgi:hypothetical protein
MADSVQYKSLPEILYCKTCNYYTCNKKQIEKHFISSKHIKNSSISAPPTPAPTEEPATATDKLSSQSDIPLAPPNTPNAIICECCGKTYKSKATFTRHQRNVQEQQQQQQQQQTIKDQDQENIDKSLELITDDDDDDEYDYNSVNSSNIEFEYITFDPLIINHDAAYFIQTFMYSIDILIGISVFINKIFSFFSLKSNDDSD